MYLILSYLQCQWCSTLVDPWRHDYNRRLGYLQRKRISYPRCQLLSHSQFRMNFLLDGVEDIILEFNSYSENRESNSQLKK
jgi:hypothetical protein